MKTVVTAIFERSLNYEYCYHQLEAFIRIPKTDPEEAMTSLKTK